MAPGDNAPQRLALPPSSVTSETLTFSLTLDKASGIKPLTLKLTRQPDLSQNLPLPTARVAGMCLRQAAETALDTSSGAQLHTAASTCGGTAKARGLFMHPPYNKGTGYTFARYALALPPQPLAFRCAVGKQDGSDLGDGILFRVVVEDAEGKRTEIAKRTVTTHAWFALEGALAPWAGKAVSLLLITDVGAKDNSSGDWAAWADLRLEPPAPAYEWLSDN